MRCSEGCPFGWKCKDDYCVPEDFTGSCPNGGEGGLAGNGGNWSGGSGLREGSPDGEFVAYDIQADGAPSSLALLNLRNLHEQVLQVTGSVIDYAWAPNKTMLALHLKSEAKDLLTAVDVSGIRGPSGGDLSNASYLQPGKYSGKNTVAACSTNGAPCGR